MKKKIIEKKYFGLSHIGFVTKKQLVWDNKKRRLRCHSNLKILRQIFKNTKSWQ